MQAYTAAATRTRTKEDVANAIALLQAAQNGYIEAVNLFLNQDGIDVNKAFHGGTTPLMLAAQNGHIEVVMALLNKDGIDVNKANLDGTTPLMFAAQNGHIEVVKALLNKDGINFNKADNYGTTPLMFAAQNGRTEVVKALLAKDGIDVNTTNRYGKTPLRLAVERRDISIIQTLLTNNDRYSNDDIHHLLSSSTASSIDPKLILKCTAFDFNIGMDESTKEILIAELARTINSNTIMNIYNQKAGWAVVFGPGGILSNTGRSSEPALLIRTLIERAENNPLLGASHRTLTELLNSYRESLVSSSSAPTATDAAPAMSS